MENREADDLDNKMVVTEAMQRRELLVRKIYDKIQRASFVDTVEQETGTLKNSGLEREEFITRAQNQYLQIRDMMEEYDQLEQAILEANARAQVETSRGKFSVAFAAALRDRLLGLGIYEEDGDFEGALGRKLEQELEGQGKIRGAGLVDPLNAGMLAEELLDGKHQLLAELEAGISISNATTWL